MAIDFNADQNRMGLALLAAAGPSARPMSFGQRMFMGLNQHDQYLAEKEQREQLRKAREAQLAFQQMQMAQMIQQQAVRKAAQDREPANEGAYRGAIRTPQQQAMEKFGGPTRAAATAAPGMVPQVDQQALIESLAKIDPMTAFQMLAPKERKLTTVAPGASLIDESDPTKAVFTAPDRQKEANPNQPFMMIDGKITPNPAYQDYELRKARAGKSDISVSYGAPVAGLKDGNPVFFQPDKGGGAPAIVPGVQPANVVEQLEKAAEAKRRTASNAAMAYTTIDKMLKHPGIDTAVGLTSLTDPRNFIPGTSAQGAKALIEQAQGQAFMQAFETLKGGGQITEKEGEKATMAIARLKTAQNEADFKAAANELRTIARDAYKRSTGQDIGAQQKQAVRTGTLNGRKVVQYSDGSTEYAD